MPHSSGIGKEETAKWFNVNKDSIQRVLDIGVGAGTYSKIIGSKKSLQKCRVGGCRSLGTVH